MDEYLDTATLMAELRRTYGNVPSYQTLHRRTIGAELPAERIRGRWRFRREHVPDIVRSLGLTPRSNAAA